MRAHLGELYGAQMTTFATYYWPYMKPALVSLAGLIFLAALISTIITIDLAIEGRNRQKGKK